MDIDLLYSHDKNKTRDMKNAFLKVTLILGALVLFSQILFAQKIDELQFFDVKQLIKEGKAVLIGQAEHSDQTYYYRLPIKLQNVVRKEVWDLGKNSAGIAIRFSTDAQCIGAKWELTNNFGMAHMAATGVKGMDLYVLDTKRNIGVSKEEIKESQNKGTASTAQKFKDAFESLSNDIKNAKNKAVKYLEGKEWKYAGTAFPNGKNSANIFVRKMAEGKREYMIYLPLYDGVESLEIGINKEAKIYSPSDDLVPKYRRVNGSKEDLPIVFYGTSVTQGGCATRPGMAYPSIIERATGVETINLGFSGNGRMDANMADFIATIPARAYVIDCLANCTYEQTRDSSEYFITKIAKAHPEADIYMINNYCYPQQFILPQNNSDMEKENALWESIYKKLKKSGYKNLKYIDVSKWWIIDNEDTVDGTHLTDMGFKHLAEAILRQMDF